MQSDDTLSKVNLAHAIKDGDKRAFDRFFLEHYAKVHRFVSAIVRNDAVIHDLAQNVFLKLWLHRGNIDEAKTLESYLFTIAKNEAISYLRRRKQIKTLNFPGSLEADKADSLLNHDEALAILNKSIREMPPRRRNIFIMHRIENMSVREIAMELNLSERTVEKHIELAIRDLRKKMK